MTGYQPFLIDKSGYASLGGFWYNSSIQKENYVDRPDRIVNIVGHRFGKLTVKRLSGKKSGKYFWHCQCDCGEEKEVQGSYLQCGDTKTCGCRFFVDETGNKYGNLFVLSPLKTIGIRGVMWKCRCDCGKECIIYGGHLRRGTRKSCGCRHEVNIEKTGCKILYGITKRKCDVKNRIFSLTLEEFSYLIKQKCTYCGSPPSQEIKRSKSKKTQIIYNGIDRIDSSLGYIVENCVSCCKFCNQSKSNLSVEKWRLHLLKIIKHLGLK